MCPDALSGRSTNIEGADATSLIKVQHEPSEGADFTSVIVACLEPSSFTEDLGSLFLSLLRKELRRVRRGTMDVKTFLTAAKEEEGAALAFAFAPIPIVWGS
jgi:hypothetical protein